MKTTLDTYFAVGDSHPMLSKTVDEISNAVSRGFLSNVPIEKHDALTTGNKQISVAYRLRNPYFSATVGPDSVIQRQHETIYRLRIVADNDDRAYAARWIILKALGVNSTYVVLPNRKKDVVKRLLELGMSDWFRYFKNVMREIPVSELT